MGRQSVSRPAGDTGIRQSLATVDGTRPTAKQPPAAAYRAVGAQLDGLTMEEKGAYLHGKYTEIESLVKIGGFYRDMPTPQQLPASLPRRERCDVRRLRAGIQGQKLYTVHRRPEHRVPAVQPAAK